MNCTHKSVTVTRMTGSRRLFSYFNSDGELATLAELFDLTHKQETIILDENIPAWKVARLTGQEWTKQTVTYWRRVYQNRGIERTWQMDGGTDRLCQSPDGSFLPAGIWCTDCKDMLLGLLVEGYSVSAIAQWMTRTVDDVYAEIKHLRESNYRPTTRVKCRQKRASESDLVHGQSAV